MRLKFPSIFDMRNHASSSERRSQRANVPDQVIPCPEDYTLTIQQSRMPVPVSSLTFDSPVIPPRDPAYIYGQPPSQPRTHRSRHIYAEPTALTSAYPSSSARNPETHNSIQQTPYPRSRSAHGWRPNPPPNVRSASTGPQAGHSSARPQIYSPPPRHGSTGQQQNPGWSQHMQGPAQVRYPPGNLRMSHE